MDRGGSVQRRERFLHRVRWAGRGHLPASPHGPSAPLPRRGYQWKELFLPEGMKLRKSSAGQADHPEPAASAATCADSFNAAVL